MQLNATKNNVNIKILTKQTKDGETDEMELCAEGTFFCKKGVYYLFYTEYTELGEVSVRLTAAEDCVTVYRNGACRSVVEYRVGTPCEYIYQLPYGELMLCAHTKKIVNALTEEGGDLKLFYKLDIHHDVFENQLTIEIRGKEAESCANH